MIRSGIITAQGNVDVGRRKRGGNRPICLMVPILLHLNGLNILGILYSCFESDIKEAEEYKTMAHQMTSTTSSFIVSIKCVGISFLMVFVYSCAYPEEIHKLPPSISSSVPLSLRKGRITMLSIILIIHKLEYLQTDPGILYKPSPAIKEDDVK